MKPKAQKRAEAEERNKRTPHEKTRAHREGRCDMTCQPKPKKENQNKRPRRSRK